ncbi:VOC family protein [Embleya scabrispora]|uniref:VOC family protein n=1 Tax=Embleya scabrispora TaxID=159449 RepID=UPI0003A46EA8|nr:VOC family protein [Embleya scabrispora]MYS82571.1 glyoxalase/bleomycin resistance/dioxygenase family protein [Streptomyces sp. SID5474]
MTAGIKTVIHPVRDLAKAKELYSRILGVEPVVDEVYYVGYRVAGQDIGLDPNGHAKWAGGPIAYWHVEDIDATYKSLVEGGAESVHEVKDVGGGKRTAVLKDADDNPIGLIQG